MSASRTTSLQHPHPSPHRTRVRPWMMWFGIVGAPLAWSLQLLVNVSLAGRGCYPHDVPLALPRWPHLDTLAGGVEAIALAVCIGAGFAAWRTWRRSRDERGGDMHHVVESGDGRTRFMALVGLMTSALFLVATAFAVLGIATVPACGG